MSKFFYINGSKILPLLGKFILLCCYPLFKLIALVELVSWAVGYILWQVGPIAWSLARGTIFLAINLWAQGGLALHKTIQNIVKKPYKKDLINKTMMTDSESSNEFKRDQLEKEAKKSSTVQDRIVVIESILDGKLQVLGDNLAVALFMQKERSEKKLRVVAEEIRTIEAKRMEENSELMHAVRNTIKEEIKKLMPQVE